MWGPVEGAERSPAARADDDGDGEHDELRHEGRQQEADGKDERTLAQPRRHEVPVAEDHRGQDPAGHGGEDHQLEREDRGRKRDAGPADGGREDGGQAGRECHQPQPVAPTPAQRDRLDDQHDRQHEQADAARLIELRAGGPDRQARRRRQAAVQKQRHPRQDSGRGGHEAEIADGRVGPAAKDGDHRDGPDREAQEKGPVDVREALQDRSVGHRGSVPNGPPR